MSWAHAGFWLLRVATEDLAKRGKFKRYDGLSLSKKIHFEGDRFIQGNAKGFFYLTLRRLFHEQRSPPPRGFAPWRPHLTGGLNDSFLPRVAVSPTSPLGLNVGGRAYWAPRPDLPALSVDDSRLLLIELSDAEGDLTAFDPLAQDSLTFSGLDRRSTKMVFTAAQASPRAAVLDMPVVELTARERRHQRRKRDEITTMRQGLRYIANRKYDRCIEKVRLKGEAKSDVKEWDAE
jgi:hypothetical protein